MLGPPLIRYNTLKLLESLLLELVLRGQSLDVIFKLSNALLLSEFVVFESGNDPLQFCLVSLLVLRDVFETIQFVKDLVPFQSDLVASLGCFLQLASDLIDVPFQSQDFLHIVLFLLLHLGELEPCSAYLFLNTLDLIVQVLILLGNSLYGAFESLNGKACVPVIL